MDIFKILENEKFFNPLTSVNKRLYFECITELIDYAKTEPVVYETNLRNRLDLYLSNKQYHFENDDTEFDYDERDSIKIICKFRECGWLLKPELGRNGEYVTDISKNCRKIIDFLNNINRKNNAGISNKILSMYEILQSAYSKDSLRKERPYSSIIVPLMDNEIELKDEILDLKDSISIIHSQITEKNNLLSMGNYLLSDELEKFFNDYFYMKNNGMIPSILTGILNKIRRFKNDSLFELAIKEYSEKMQVNYEESKILLEKYIDEIYYYYISIEYRKNMELIDEKINKYYRLANMRIKLLTSSGINIQSSIDSILSKIKESNNDEKEIIINKLRNCINITSQKYISRKSYQKKKRQVIDNNVVSIDVEDISEEEKNKITNELISNSINPYSIERTNNFFKEIFQENNISSIKSKNINNKEEALMFASAFIYSGEKEFDYLVELHEGYEETDVADITNMEVRRKD